MKDVKCPYCNAEQDIDHDDGHGYAENEIHQQECVRCNKTFTFTTSIMYHYDVDTADCLNDGEHDWNKTTTYPRECTKMECSMCGETRIPTKEEMDVIMSKNK